MKSLRLPLAAAICLACATPVRADLDLSEWLYYSMYSGDYSHSVHLPALKERPDGLLESASRYPRHQDESWTKDESDRGWYNYVPRLLDCETGLSIETSEHLLDADGKIIATRETGQKSLAEWKESLDRQLAGHKWPVKNELFMACAAVRDEKLAAARKKLAETPPPRLTYKPIMASLREETSALVERASMLQVSGKDGEKTTAALFDDAARAYTAWLSGFKALPVSERLAAQPGLSESRLTWLKERRINVLTITSPGDGTLEYTNGDPTNFDVPYSVLEQRPALTDNAAQAAMLQRLDCRSGIQLGLHVDWQDENRALLARQALPVDEMAPVLERQIALFNQEPENFFAPLEGSPVQLICIAAAAQCNDSKPRLPEAFVLKAADWKAIEAATTPADALLVVRAAYRNYRQRFVPNCQIGNPN